MAAMRRLPVFRTLGRDGKPWNRADKIALWLGICTLLLTAIGLYQTYVSNSKRPSLELAAVSAAETTEINAVDQNQDGETLGPNRVDGQRIDITLRNSGSAESLIYRAELNFKLAGRLIRCRQVGGAVEIAANYDVKVPAPWGDPFSFYSLKTPFTLNREMRFTVAPGSHERLIITVGPERIPEMAMPWIYTFDVLLRHDDNAALNVGTVNMLGNSAQTGIRYTEDGSPIKPESKEEMDCLRNNLRVVRMHQLLPGIQGGYLEEYSRELGQYAADVGLT